jgi:hypothetical protein
MLSLAGTGNVLKIQNLLHICSEHYEEKEKEAKEPKESDSRETKDAKGKTKDAAAGAPKEEPKPKLDGSHQGVAVLGISLIAMGEEIGAQMALRTFRHLVSVGWLVVGGWVVIGEEEVDDVEEGLMIGSGGFDGRGGGLDDVEEALMIGSGEFDDVEEGLMMWRRGW